MSDKYDKIAKKLGIKVDREIVKLSKDTLAAYNTLYNFSKIYEKLCSVVRNSGKNCGETDTFIRDEYKELLDVTFTLIDKTNNALEEHCAKVKKITENYSLKRQENNSFH